MVPEMVSPLPPDATSKLLPDPDDANRALIEQADVGNLLLRRMDACGFEMLRPHLARVPLKVGSDLARAGDPITTICFPEGAVAGFLDVLGGGRRLTIGLVGREGCVGWPLLMGYDRWPYDVSVRGETSTALRIDAERFSDVAERSPEIRTLLLRFAGTFTAQMGRTIISNLIHSVEQRTARWILLYQDRVRSEQIVVTHEELGYMLGVRRQSVTDALHFLEGGGAIKSSRGKLVVRDRLRLETLATDTYGFAEAEYRRLIGMMCGPDNRTGS